MAEENVVSEEPEAQAEVATTEVVETKVEESVETNTEATNEYKATTESINIDNVKVGDGDYTVSVPPEIINFLGEKGLDADSLIKEFYTDGKMEFTPETLAKLNEEFGEVIVSGYLQGVKATNEMFISDHAKGLEETEALGTAAWESTLELMGGEDKWNDMSAYAMENLSEEEFDEFNEVMENGSLMVQKLLIADVFNKFTEAGAPPAPQILDLETGQGGGDPLGGKEALSSKDYFALIKDGTYKSATKEERAVYDSRRRAGME